MINPGDLADLLGLQGFFVDYDTGEVNYEPDQDLTVLILLDASGKLHVGRDAQFEPEFISPDLHICDMISYCKVYPYDPQCKCYDV